MDVASSKPTNFKPLLFTFHLKNSNALTARVIFTPCETPVHGTKERPGFHVTIITVQHGRLRDIQRTGQARPHLTYVEFSICFSIRINPMPHLRQRGSLTACRPEANNLRLPEPPRISAPGQRWAKRQRSNTGGAEPRYPREALAAV